MNYKIKSFIIYQHYLFYFISEHFEEHMVEIAKIENLFNDTFIMWQIILKLYL